MKCPKCYFPMIWRGACVTVDDVKYRAYVCHRTPECPGVIRGERYEPEEAFDVTEISKLSPERRKRVAEKLGKIIEEVLDRPEEAED